MHCGGALVGVDDGGTALTLDFVGGGMMVLVVVLVVLMMPLHCIHAGNLLAVYDG